MRLTNFDDFQRAMDARGRNADAYLEKIERKIAKLGYYNEDYTHYSGNNNGYIDDFVCVIKGVLKNDVQVSEPVYCFCEVATPNNKLNYQ